MFAVSMRRVLCHKVVLCFAVIAALGNRKNSRRRKSPGPTLLLVIFLVPLPTLPRPMRLSPTRPRGQTVQKSYIHKPYVYFGDIGRTKGILGWVK
jgi:hypothetical protein